MLKLFKKNLEILPVLGAIIFLGLQVISDLSLPKLTSNLINYGVAKGDINYIIHIGLAMLGLSILSILASSGNVYFASTQAQKLGAKLRSQIFKHVINFSGNEVEKFGSSSLITRTTNDVLQLQNVVVMMLRMMLMAPLMLFGASFMAYFTEKRLTILFLIAIPILLVVVGVAMYYAVPLFQKLQKQIDKINLVFREGLTGVRVIRAFRQDEREQKRFDQANQDYTKTGIRVFSIVSLLFPFMTIILNATNIGIVWFGSHMIADKSMQVGNLVSFMTYASMILFSFMMLSMIFVFVPRAAAAAKRINEVLETQNSIIEPEFTQTNQDANPELSFENVEFRYPGAEKEAIERFSTSVKGGQTLALIGGTGSGKSTLINLIPRFYDVTNGSVKVDGQDVKAYQKAALHEKVAFVQQKAVLFKGTIRSNLAYGKADATDEEMWRALEIAQAKDFVMELEGKLDATVEQNGDNFSGGQKQRLAIARALIKEASIYVFDDSFSALDFKTDAKLRQALKEDEKLSQKVMVIVAQRISTVTNADKILVLDDGKVVGQGTHEELMAENEVYQTIVKSQLKEGEA